jgi:hypothetical protein
MMRVDPVDDATDPVDDIVPPQVGYIKWSEAADLVAPDAPKMRLTHMKAAGILALACIGIIAVAVRRRHQPAAQAEEPTAPAML